MAFFGPRENHEAVEVLPLPTPFFWITLNAVRAPEMLLAVIWSAPFNW